jgi:hypothetical protein
VHVPRVQGFAQDDVVGHPDLTMIMRRREEVRANSNAMFVKADLPDEPRLRED